MPLPVHEWPHPALQATITETNEATTYPIEIYTDGSKDASMVGAGVIYRNKQIMQYRYKLRSYCSNNQAEQIAILKALEQLQEIEAPMGKRVAIYTDSRVTIDSLKNHDTGFSNRKNKEHYSTSSHAKLDDTLKVGEGAHRD